MTEFVGDIIFNNCQKNIQVNDMAIVNEVNETLDNFIKKELEYLEVIEDTCVVFLSNLFVMLNLSIN